MLAAQANLLAEATARVFELETLEKENRPKVDRLHDYEDKINQLLKAQRLWYVYIPFTFCSFTYFLSLGMMTFVD